jgi:hypothetical protein
LRVTLRSDAQLPSINPPQDSGVPLPSGSFTIQNATPGNYRVNVAPILNLGPGPAPANAQLQSLYVKSIRLGDTDVLNDGLSITVQPPDGPLVVVLATRPGAITGSAIDEKQQPAPETTVVLAPDTEHRGRVDLFKTVVTDAMGHFRLDRVPPGNYKLFAWDDVENGAWLDGAFLSRYEDQGTRITVSEGGTNDVQLSLIPAQ